jgi:chromatin segregation and condensation protein Rec8/ScpA/Scc1 (kleisin family)
MSEQSPEKVNTSEAPAETFSLASILSEYKSEAFIRNERRYSKEELEKRADEIIR